ncbi:unnamed protein product, partial [Timema podura]|nr:unnamed protein product [Timema podura]
SGLTDACRKSKTSLQDAERSLMSFIKTYIPKEQLEHWLSWKWSTKSECKQLSQYIRPRFNLDHPIISSVVEHESSPLDHAATGMLHWMRWNPQIYDQAPKKVLKHRALDDIRESIEELRYYRSAMFIKPDIEHLR